jgi:zinc protease
MPIRSLAAVLLAAAACVTNGAAPPSAGSRPAAAPATVATDKLDGDVREVTLTNGLRILVKEDHAAPVATLAVYYRAGSRDEHTGITGSAHLLEHLLFKGSRAFPGPTDIMDSLSRIGASFNATTYYDRTNYYATVPISQLPFVIRLESDRMRHATFSDADRASEMTVVRNELERGENDPGRVLHHQLWATSIESHPYHHPVIGWRSDVENVPTARLREFYDRYYHPSNATLVVVGDVQPDALVPALVAAFGENPAGPPVPPVYTTEEPQRGERRFTIRKPGELALVELGWRMPSATSPDVPALKILQLVLSGSLDLNEFGDPLDPGISNRLYQALIETQLATRFGMDYTLMIDPNVGSISGTVRPGVQHQQVEDAIRREVARLRDEPVSTLELERSKRRARAAFGLSQDGTFGQAMALGYFATIADWRFVREFAPRIEAVTAADVQRVARAYFQDDSLTVGWFVPISAGGPMPSSPSGGAGPQKLREADDHAEAAAVTSRALAAQGSAGASPGASRRAMPQRRVLPNGLVVVVQENPSTQSFALSGSIRAGSVHEPNAEAGTASITANLLERGTTKRTKLALAAQLEEVGGSVGFGDGFESVSASAFGLGGDFERIFDVFAEDLLSPAFPQDELEKLKAQRIAGLQQSEDSTRVKARRAVQQALYPKDHPLYYLDVSEAIAATKAIDVARVRAWYQRFYAPDRTILSVVGNVKAEDVFRTIEARLGAWKPVGGPPVAVAPVPPPPSPSRRTISVPERSNVDIVLGTTGDIARTSPDFYPAFLGNHVLGGGTAGRLFKRVRAELGLTYGIGSSLTATQIAGPWTVSLSVNPKVVDQAIDATQKVLERWVADGITEQELSAAKTALSGLFQVSLATNGGLANTFTYYESLGLGADFVYEHPRRLEAVTVEQVNAAIKQHFPVGRMVTGVAGSVPAR